MYVWLWTIVIAVALWVYFDAKNIGVRRGLLPDGVLLDAGAGGWAIAVLLFWPLFLPMYVATRSRLKQAAQAQRDDDGP